MRVLPALFLFGCSSVAPTVDTDGPPLRQVTVEVGDQLELHLAGAWLDDNGGGHGVAVKATASGAPALEISGDKSSWDLDKGTAQFEGQVVVTRGPFTLHTDLLDVFWVDDRVDRAVATGRVVVSKDDRIANADRGVLDGETGKFTLTGNATLAEGGNQMRGDTIVLWLDDGRLECTRCTLALDEAAVGRRD